MATEHRYGEFRSRGWNCKLVILGASMRPICVAEDIKVCAVDTFELGCCELLSVDVGSVGFGAYGSCKIGRRDLASASCCG